MKVILGYKFYSAQDISKMFRISALDAGILIKSGQLEASNIGKLYPLVSEYALRKYLNICTDPTIENKLDDIYSKLELLRTRVDEITDYMGGRKI